MFKKLSIKFYTMRSILSVKKERSQKANVPLKKYIHFAHVSA